MIARGDKPMGWPWEWQRKRWTLFHLYYRAKEEEEFSGAAAEDMQGGTYIENTLTDVYS